MNGRLILVASAVMCALSLSAETWKWVGGAEGGNAIDQKANWVNASTGNPPTNSYDTFYGGGDVWVFDPGEGETLTVKNATISWPSFPKVRRIEVLSGTVTIEKNGNSGGVLMQLATSSDTSTLYVAENANLVLREYLGIYYSDGVSDDDTRVIAKAGKGEVSLYYPLGEAARSAGQQPKVQLLDVREGGFYRCYYGSLPHFYVNEIVVGDGGEFGWDYAMIDTAYTAAGGVLVCVPSIHVEKGGRVLVKASTGTKLDGISGEGEFAFTGDHPITLRLQKRDYSFGGTFGGNTLNISSEATKTLTVASSDAFANMRGDSEGICLQAPALKFAPGIGEFRFNRYDATLGVPLELTDTDGQPVTLHCGFANDAYIMKSAFTGTGNLYVTPTVDEAHGFTNGQLQVAGTIGSDAGGRIVLGRGDAATDPDLSGIGAIDAKGALTFAGGGTLEAPCPVTSEGALRALGPTKIASIRKTGGALTVAKRLEIDGGEIFGPDATWRNQYEQAFARPRRAGLNPGYQSADGMLVLKNCRAWFGNGQYSDNQPALPVLSATDSIVELLREPKNDSYHATGDYFLDGATLRFGWSCAMYNFLFPSDLNASTGATTKPWTISVGAKGARLASGQACGFVDSTYHTLILGATVKTATGVERDGGVVLGVANSMNLCRPLLVSGPVTVAGCRVVPVAAAYQNAADGKSVLGTGDLVIEDGWLALRTGSETRAASGAGAKLRASGSGAISFRNDTGTAGTLTVGADGAESSSLEIAANGALFLMDRSGTASSFGPSSGKVIVKGGVESYANGRVKAPVFSAVNGAFDGFDLNFLKYDETNGFSDFTGYVNDFDGQADSVLYANGNVKPCAVPAGETREVAALRVLCNQTDSWNDSLITPALTINANATLKVGAGDRPAQVLLNNRGTYGRAVIAGAGALDFGSAGAVIACASARSGANGVYPARISARIAGSGPVTFAGLFGVRYASVVVDGDNTYSGGTEIAAISVRCKSDAAFGTGPVRVRGNVACGGQICFAKAGVTISNPLTVSGYGNTCFAGTAESYEPGALWFVQDATVAGPVTIDGFARVGGRKHTSTGSVVGTGTFTGAISGEISPAGADRIGTLTFATGVLSVAGATFVCEAAPEGADRIVVEEPFDLSPIALRTVNLGGRGYATPVFRTEGLTGEFSSTAFGVKWHEIKYGEMDATLEAFKPGMALFIR